jgi:VWFA-related protein
MKSRCLLIQLVSLVIVLVAAVLGHAQEIVPQPAPQPTPPINESQERVKVFTEEVVLPVTAYDDSGHLSAALETSDIIVFEDDVRQQVRSIRRIPANVLLMLDTGGEMNPAMSASTTREIASRLISNLRDGDRIAAIQFGSRVEVLQEWTTDRQLLLRALKWKLLSSKGSHLMKALMTAAAQLKEVPAGTRHIVLITDGVDSSSDREALTAAIRQLLDSNVTVHVISYTAIGRKTIDRQNPPLKITTEKRKSAKDIADEIMYPTQQSDAQRRDKVYLIIDTDIAMRKQHRAYEEATRQSEVWLSNLAGETGGLVFLPVSSEEMISRGEEIARQVDSQYVVTYTPKRPLALATEEEYRRIDVAAGRIGLHVHARRGYVATAQGSSN